MEHFFHEYDKLTKLNVLHFKSILLLFLKGLLESTLVDLFAEPKVFCKFEELDNRGASEYFPDLFKSFIDFLLCNVGSEENFGIAEGVLGDFWTFGVLALFGDDVFLEKNELKKLI